MSQQETTIQNTDAITQYWRVVAASVRGVSHEKTGLPCQDAHRWQALPARVLAAAVADGAGSALFAEVGAACAADAGVAALANRLTYEVPAEKEPIQALLVEALQCARAAVEAEAAARDLTPRDLATTLIVALATERWVAVAQVGDGATVAAGADGSLHALTVPPVAEYANETIFLTSPDAIETAQHSFHVGPVARIALFSDGLQRLALKLPEGAPHAPFFTPLFRFAAETIDAAAAHSQLAAFLTSPRITERADDDLTLLLATLPSIP